MARARGKIQRFGFTKGWNTEASPMTFPENTAQDLENVVLDIDGSIRRRLGVTTESRYPTRRLMDTSTAYETTAIGFGKWENVAGSGDLTILVSQVGTKLNFSLEDGTQIAEVDFSSTVIIGKGVKAGKSVLEFASGLGYLFCTGPYTEPFYVDYNNGSPTITSFSIKIRDFEGVDDGLAIDTRPSGLTNQHEYNLRNQGWVNSFDCAVNGGSDATTDPVSYTKTHLGVYPSNADILYLGKAGSGTDEDDIGRYDPKTMAKNAFGTTQAPRGKFILDAFDQNRSAIVAGADSLTINNRPRAVAFHNGRAFFAGVNALGQSGNVYYSQQLTDISLVGRCYQQNDPTAEDFNELLATDGGLLKIPDCGNILRLQEGPQGIVVFASNGVWEISGENGRFAADNLFVRKVTSLGCISRESVIKADNSFFYWSDAGIVGSQQDQVTGTLSLDVVTRDNIQIGYQLFGGPQRRGSRGTFMRADKKCVWLYSTDSDYNNVSHRFKYNGILILDLALGAFYKYRISDIGYSAVPYVSGVLESESFIATTTTENVTVNGTTVTVNGTNLSVEVDAADPDSVRSTMLLQTVYPGPFGSTTEVGICHSTFSSRYLTDWYFYDDVGADYSSYIETGYELGGEAMLDKQPKYVHTYMSKTPKHSRSGNFYNLTDPTNAYGFDTLLTEEFLFGIPPVQASNTKTYQHTELSGVASQGFSFHPSGLRLYVYETGATARVYEYGLTTAFDISTINTTPLGFLDTSSENSTAGIGSMYIDSTGTYMHLVESNEKIVHQYVFSTPGNIASCSYTGNSFDVNAASVGVSGIIPVFNNDGSKMIWSDSTGTPRIYEQTLSTPYNITTGGATTSTLIGSGSYLPDTHFVFKSDGTAAIFITSLTSTDQQAHLVLFDTAWDTTTINLRDTHGLVQIGQAISGSGSGIYYIESGELISSPKFFASEYTTGSTLNIYEYVIDSELYDMATWLAETEHNSMDDVYSPSTQLAVEKIGNSQGYAEGVAFNSNGTKLWAVCFTGLNRAIQQWTLSTAYDLDTATYDGQQAVTFANSATLRYRPDGQGLYLSGSTLGTKYYSFNADIDDITGGITEEYTNASLLYGFDFISSTAIIRPNRAFYTLSAPYNLVGATKGSDITTFTSSTYHAFFMDGGTKFYVQNVNSCNVYTLTSAYDLATATFSNTIATGSTIKSYGCEVPDNLGIFVGAIPSGTSLITGKTGV